METKITRDNFKSLLPSIRLAISELSGECKRRYLGQLAIDLGRGGASLVSNHLPISRVTLRKGIREVESGQYIKDKFEERGRHPAEKKLPNLLSDIRAIVEPASQTDPSFKSTRLYTRLTPREVRQQLIKRGYSDEKLPTNRTLLTKMKSAPLDFVRTKVSKTKPKKN